jgi:ABC-2 type transport system ATP-binding protein
MADRIGVINKGELILVEEKSALMRRLGRKFLTVQLPLALKRLPDALAAHALTLSHDGTELIYSYDAAGEESGITALLQDLSHAGIAFKDLRTEQSSLEDIFVDLVKANP